jgi:hypothetical protein
MNIGSLEIHSKEAKKGEDRNYEHSITFAVFACFCSSFFVE